MPRPRLRRRRVVSFVLVVMFAAFASLLGPASAASAAGTGPGCPVGSILGLPSSFSPWLISCIDSGTGDFLGYYSQRSGDFYADTLQRTAIQLDVPSSAIAGGETSTATVAEGAGLAEVDATAGGGLLDMMAATGGTTAGGILAAGAGGYMLGQYTVNYVCQNYSWSSALSFSIGGVSTSLCGSEAQNYTPNGDLGANPNGWKIPPPWADAGIGLTNVTLNPESQVQYGQPFTTTATDSGFQWGWHYDAGTYGYTSVAIQFGVRCVNGTNQIVTLGAGPYGQALNTTGDYHGSTPSSSIYAGRTVCGSYGGVADVESLTLTGHADTANGNSNTYNVTGAVWYPVGNPNRPVYNTDPGRVLFQRDVCVDSNGNLTNDDGPYSATFTEATVSTLPNVPGVTSQCPAGTSLSAVKIIERTLDGSIPDHVLKTITVPDPVKLWHQTYPGCEAGVCRLGLYQVNADGTEKLDCWNGDGSPNDGCAQWFTDPTKTSDYVCTYGPNNDFTDTHVDLSECNAYAPSFDPQKRALGVGYGDPKTGKTPDGKPKSGGGSGSGDPGPVGSPGQGGSSCYPTGWGVFNPVEWVLRPVKCALAWAFEPDVSAIEQEWSSTWSDVSGRPPLSVVMPMVTFVQGMAGGLMGNCGGGALPSTLPAANDGTTLPGGGGANLADFGNGLVIPCSPPSGISTYIGSMKVAVEVLLFGLTAFGLWRMAEGSFSS